MDLKGSKTEKNLYRTFAGEARARDKYNFYADKARSEGYQWIGQVFDETATNELAHARVVYSTFLRLVGNTKENLLAALLGEAGEAKDIYVRFQKEAEAEGFIDIAEFFKEIAEVEEAHCKKFTGLLDKLEDGTMFKGTKESKWVCMNCGYIHEGEEAPLVCPLCSYPQGYFKPYCSITNV